MNCIDYEYLLFIMTVADNSQVAQINYHYLYISLEEKKGNYSGGTKK